MAAAGGLCLSIASLYQKMRRLWHLNAYFILAVQSGESLSQAVKTFLWYVFIYQIFSGSVPDPVFFLNCKHGDTSQFIRYTCTFWSTQMQNPCSQRIFGEASTVWQLLLPWQWSVNSSLMFEPVVLYLAFNYNVLSTFCAPLTCVNRGGQNISKQHLLKSLGELTPLWHCQKNCTL